jgi:hypothetical protein
LSGNVSYAACVEAVGPGGDNRPGLWAVGVAYLIARFLVGRVGLTPFVISFSTRFWRPCVLQRATSITFSPRTHLRPLFWAASSKDGPTQRRADKKYFAATCVSTRWRFFRLQKFQGTQTDARVDVAALQRGHVSRMNQRIHPDSPPPTGEDCFSSPPLCQRDRHSKRD